MSKPVTGGHAFPFEKVTRRVGGDVHEWHNHPGMTQRDYFAAKAMQAIIGTLNGPVTCEQATGEFEHYAKAAYRMADAMIRVRGAQS